MSLTASSNALSRYVSPGRSVQIAYAVVDPPIPARLRTRAFQPSSGTLPASPSSTGYEDEITPSPAPSRFMNDAPAAHLPSLGARRCKAQRVRGG